MTKKKYGSHGSETKLFWVYLRHIPRFQGNSMYNNSVVLGTVHLIFGDWDFPCSDIALENNPAQWHSEKDNLSPIVLPKLTYRLV